MICLGSFELFNKDIDKAHYLLTQYLDLSWFTNILVWMKDESKLRRHQLSELIFAHLLVSKREFFSSRSVLLIYKFEERFAAFLALCLNLV